jgi:putative spermidine/putrescine transport system permease protein
MMDETIDPGKPIRVILLTFTIAVAALMAAPCVYQLVWAFFGTSTPGILTQSPSLHWFLQVLQSHSWRAAFVLSAKLSLFVTVASTCSLFVCNYLAMVNDARGSAFTHTAFVAAIVTPSVLYGLALQFMRGYVPVGETAALFMGHLAMVLPTQFLLIYAVGQRLPHALLQSALVQGAGHYKIVKTVVLPLIWSPLLMCALFAFAISFDELVVDLFVINSSNQTVSKYLWDGRSTMVEPYPAVVTLFLVAGYVGSASIAMAGRRLVIAKRR